MKKKSRGIEMLKKRYGMLFTAHWTFGLIVFFAVPLILSVLYSFSNVKIVPGGVNLEFVGFKYYKYLLTEDAQFVNNLRDDIIKMFYTVPIIVALSFVQAVVLNGKFKGRMFARAMFFLPVIIATGAVMDILSKNSVGCEIFLAATKEGMSQYGSNIDFSALLQNLNLPASFTHLFETWFTNIFTLIWSCGVQTILFISGLQTIPDSLYEVAKVEGANKWEEFWFITMPMLGNVMLLIIIYTFVEFFVSTNNLVMSQALSVMNTSQVYDRSSAMLWFYLVVAGLIIGFVILLYNRICQKKCN